MPLQISDAELAHLHDCLSTWFDQVCNILRAPEVEDVYGGSGLGTFAVVATGVPCFVDPGTSVGHRLVEALEGLLRDRQLFSVSFSPEVDVRLDDRIVLTSEDNLTLRVQVVMDPESFQIEKIAICNRLL